MKRLIIPAVVTIVIGAALAVIAFIRRKTVNQY